MTSTVQFGKLLRQWRRHRRQSQLALAGNAEISTKHLSFLETGRSAPSRDMILRLSEELQIPLRQRNALLTAGGFAESYPERTINDPGLQLMNEVIHTVLKGHEPNPALVVDFRWNVIAINRSLQVLLGGVALCLLEPPMNSMRLALHPDGLASRIFNFKAWRGHAIGLIKHRADLFPDPDLVKLLDEVEGYTYPNATVSTAVSSNEDFAIPLRLTTLKGDISFVTATLALGFPSDVTVSELTIECLFPTDKEASNILRALVEEG